VNFQTHYTAMLTTFRCSQLSSDDSHSLESVPDHADVLSQTSLAPKHNSHTTLKSCSKCQRSMLYIHLRKSLTNRSVANQVSKFTSWM